MGLTFTVCLCYQEKFFDGAGCPANAKVSNLLFFFYRSAHLICILGVKKQVEKVGGAGMSSRIEERRGQNVLPGLTGLKPLTG